MSYVLGKLGKSAVVSSNSLQANSSPFKNTTTYSVCGWIYLDSLGVTHTIICSRTNIGYGLSILIVTSNQLRIDASIDATSLQWTTDYSFKAGEWTHFAVVNDDGKLSYYINGEFKQTKTVTSTTQHIGNYMTIGASSESNTVLGNNNYFKGKMNDLRIYDHALSQSEVQEIYRSLILKYSFDTPIEDPKISTAKTVNIDSYLDGGINRCPTIGTIIYSKDYVVDNEYITLSFDLTIEDLKAVEGQMGKMQLQEFTVISGENKWSTLINTGIGSTNGTSEIDLTKNGTYHIVKSYQWTDTSRYSSNWAVQLRLDYILGGTATISNFKVVLGKKEILSDGTGGILYDESGFGHNATVMGSSNFLPTIYYSTDAKIGEGCYQSKTITDGGKNTYGVVRTSKIFDEVPEISISFWLYVPEIDNNTGDNTILGCSPNAENYGIWIRRDGVSLVSTLYHTSLSPTTLQRDRWHYIVVTAQKQGDLKVYLDGELNQSKNNIVGVDWESAYLTIGDLRYNRGLKLDGKIDDLKIYATVLDEIYIKKMYQERVKVDNNGNMSCGELIEVKDNNIFSFDNVTNYRELPNIKDAFFDNNSLIITSTNGAENPRYFRVKMKFSAGKYKIFRIYNVIGDNYTSTTGRFHISKSDWSQSFININPKDSYGIMTLAEDTDTYITFVASEKDSNVDEITVQFLIYIYSDSNQEIQETKIFENGEIKTYNLKETNEKQAKIYNKQKTVQAETLYEY